MNDPHRDTDLPDTATVRVNTPGAVVERFITAWACGDEPLVAEFAGNAASDMNTELAAELVRIDMHERASRGLDVCLDSYLADLPELKETPVEIIALILDEYSIRTEAGHLVTFDEYARRFPEHLDTLRRELDLTSDATGEYGAQADLHRDERLANTGDSDDVESDWFSRAPDTLDGPQSCERDDLATRSEATHIGPLTKNGQLVPGTRLGDFQIERLIGQGGLARVYKARQLSLDRIVALKVTSLPEGTSDAQAGDEGRNMAALVHDHIVPVFSQERTNGYDVLAMGYVSGPTLSELLDTVANTGRPTVSAGQCHDLIQNLSDDAGDGVSLPQSSSASGRFLPFALRMLRDLAQALAHAHRKGILHCDVKPANILFAPSARAMLTDFNVSVRSDARSDDAVGGTLQYMSPEQLAAVTGAGPTDAVDERSDVYSLGLVLFELLTGERPFANAVISGNPLTAAGEMLAARLSGALEFPEADIWLPAAVQSIVRKSLESSPARRYQSADDMAADLDRWLSSQPLKHAPDTDRIDRAKRWINRHRVSTTGALCVAVFGLIMLTRQNEPPIVVDVAAVTSDVPSGEENRVALELDRQARQLLAARKPAEALPLLQRAAELNPSLAAVHHNLGITQFRLGHFGAALIEFDKAIELGRVTALMLSHRAAARFALDDVEGARSDFDRSLEIARPSERQEVEANIAEFESLLTRRSH